MNDVVITAFQELLQHFNEDGDIGFCSFNEVFDTLLPVQQEYLHKILGERFDGIYQKGSFICFGIAYKDDAIDVINARTGLKPDYFQWNKYALEYDRLNQILNVISKSLAIRFKGIALTATIGGLVDKISHVSEYFPMVVSHRAIAEKAGLGWRGKNQLVIHERFSCAIRFASVIVDIPLKYGSTIEGKCGECTACEDVCTFIKNRSQLKDYRENCRRYILFLKSKGITKDICGKCIKACYRSSIFQDEFKLD